MRKFFMTRWDAQPLLRSIPTVCVFAISVVATLVTTSLFADDSSSNNGDGNLGGPAPWERPQESDDTLTGMRGFLEHWGVQQSDLFNLFDGDAISDNERPIIMRVLTKLQRLQYEDEQEWSEPANWTNLLEEPGKHRGRLKKFSGQVTLIEKLALSEKDSLTYEIDHFYRLTVKTENAPYLCEVLCRVIPHGWQLFEPVNYSVMLNAVFLKQGPSKEDAATMLFVAERPQWTPKTAAEIPELPGDCVFLASLGIDVGRISDLRRTNKQALLSRDTEAFYQSLANLSAAKRAEVVEKAEPTLDLAALLVSPAEHQGELMMVKGTARKISRVLVTDREIQTRFGIHEYFQIDVFLPVGDQTIVLGDDAESSPSFSSTYPSTVCVLKAPPELAKFAEQATERGELINETISIPAMYFKLWAYKSRYVAEFGEEQRQWAPLFIGMTPEVIEDRRAFSPWIGVAAACLFVFAIASLWFGVWRYGRGDEEFQRNVLRQHSRRMGQRELEELPDEPDFSQLEK